MSKNIRRFSLNARMPEYTIGKVGDRDLLTNILNDIREDPYKNSSRFLFIYYISKPLTRITIYPIESDGAVWKFKILLNRLKDNTLSSITQFMTETPIIHTTGLSKKDNYYYVELYVNGTSNWNDALSIADKIGTLEEVENLEVMDITHS